MLLVNHALARGTPAIFVVSRGSSSKALVLLDRMQLRHFRHFRHFRQKPLFLAGQKHGLPKAPFSGPRMDGSSLSFFMHKVDQVNGLKLLACVLSLRF